MSVPEAADDLSSPTKESACGDREAKVYSRSLPPKHSPFPSSRHLARGC